jgi:adenosylhomocysteine nucleosidase
MSEPLLVFALEAETQGLFDTYNQLYTGCGKVQATYELTRRLAETRPSLIVNLGTAGSARITPGTVVHCRQFVQRDMEASALGVAPEVTPFSDIPATLAYGSAVEGLPEAVCGTGDSFVTHRRDMSYDIVDMEAYALALVAMREHVPFACLKYISDSSDENAADDWSHALRRAATALAQALLQVLADTGIDSEW